MKKEELTKLLLESKIFFSKEWLNEYEAFFQEEILLEFSKKLIQYDKEGVSKKLPLPLFNEETTPLLRESFEPFEEVLNTLDSGVFNIESSKKELVKAIENIDFKHLLLLLGQRITSATVQNADGIPPLQTDLLVTSFQPYNHQVSKAVRAFEKHAERTTDNFWGTITGNPKEKEEKVKHILTTILNDKTWWNVFYHYKHELIYEIRIPSGHGIRWKKNTLEFIGFVEPFLN